MGGQHSDATRGPTLDLASPGGLRSETPAFEVARPVSCESPEFRPQTYATLVPSSPPFIKCSKLFAPRVCAGVGYVAR
eukprot:6652115-Pyramimonas_sp.AAC.1